MKLVAVMVIDARGLGWLGWCRGTNTLGSNAEPMRAVEGLYIAGPAMPAVTPLADRPSYSTLAWRCGSRFRWAIRTPEGFGELIRLAIVKGFADLVGCLAPVRSVRGIVPFESLGFGCSKSAASAPGANISESRAGLLSGVCFPLLARKLTRQCK